MVSVYVCVWRGGGGLLLLILIHLRLLFVSTCFTNTGQKIIFCIYVLPNYIPTKANGHLVRNGTVHSTERVAMLC
jgi:hypothetical protein